MKDKVCILFFSVCTLFAFSSYANGTFDDSEGLMTKVIFVDNDASSVGNGKNWSSAYKYLQDGLASARIFADMGIIVEIWVAEGTYYPDEGTGYTDNARDSSFMMHNNVSILGGFKGNEVSNSQRNWKGNVTVLSGDIRQDDTQKTFHVVYNTLLNSTAILSGFTISDGSANFSPSEINGGAIYNVNSSPLFEYCIFKDNFANTSGAVAFNSKSSPEFKNCLFIENSTLHADQIMIYTSTGNTSVINSTLISGTSGTSGYFRNEASGSSTIQNSICWGRSPFISNDAGSSSTVQYTLIQGGHAGVGNIDQNPVFTDSLNGDFSLDLCSPAINGGENSLNSSNLDLDHSNRVQFDIVDMGCLETSGHRLYVDIDANGSKDGSSWTDAFDKLQNALSVIHGCNGSPIEICIAEGIYYPDEGVGLSNNDRNNAFEMKNHMSLYGGFLGNETILSQRIPAAYQVILSGEIQQNNMSDDNAYHVIKNEFTSGNPLTNSARLDGLYIQSGNADNGTGLNDRGGGILNIYSSPNIINCYFSVNRADFGGAIFNEDSDPLISSCTFFQNESNRDGGAIFNTSSDPTILNSTFTQNKSFNPDFLASGGGAIKNTLGSAPNISNTNFIANESRTVGGAVANSGSSAPIFTSCIFNQNESESGGAIQNAGSNVIFNSCTFSQNQSKPKFLMNDLYNGGAIYHASGEMTTTKCVFDQNQSQVYGGGIYVFSGTINSVKDTFRSNEALLIQGEAADYIDPSGGGIYVDENAKVFIENGVFRNCHTSERGGAIYIKSIDSSFVNGCLFDDNSADIGGAGIYIETNAAYVYNSIFINNYSITRGAAFYISNSIPRIINCTFFKNKSGFNEGDGIYNESASPKLINNIFWNNNSEIFTNSGAPDVENCVVKGGYLGGTNIISAYPEFMDSASLDLTLKKCSPAIDTGNNLFNSILLDFSNNQRIYDAKNDGTATIDLGAYEFQESYLPSCCPVQLNLSGNISSGLYQASSSITCSGTIPAGADVILSAPDSVIMTNDFEVIPTGLLQIDSTGCN